MNATDSSINIALKHIKTSLVFLALFFLLIIVSHKDFGAGYFMNIKVIAVTHIFTLGFLLSIIIGASYMLLPVAIGVKIAYEKLFSPAYYAYTAGILIFFAGMYFGVPAMIAVGGGLLFGGVALYCFNIFASIKKVKKWDYSSVGILLAYIYLALAVSAGFYLALSFYLPSISYNLQGVLEGHVYSVFIGFVLTLFISVSYRLLPMFYMVKNPAGAIWKTDIILVNAGVVMIFVSPFFGGTAERAALCAGGLSAAAGILLYCYEFYFLMAGRMKRRLDVTSIYLFLAINFLALSVILGIVRAFYPSLLSPYGVGFTYAMGFAALFCFAGMAVIGFLHKIFPFLVSLKMFEKAKKGAYGKLFGTKTLHYFEYGILAVFIIGIISLTVSLIAGVSGYIAASASILLAGSISFAVRVFLMEH